jgi:hypothetical protein
MKEVEANEFNGRREKCREDIRNILDFLMTVAEYAGPQVERGFHGKGEGITYRTGRRLFCVFDPKHHAHNVGALVRNADRIKLKAAGKVSNREDGPWVKIYDMRAAVRLVPEILLAYDVAATRR